MIDRLREQVRAVGICVISLVAVGTGSAQEAFIPPMPPVPQIPSDGTQIFRELLALERLTSLKGPDEAMIVDPSQTILIVLGSQGPMEPTAKELSQVILRNGGAVLIASNGPMDLNGYVPGQNSTRLSFSRVRSFDPDNCFEQDLNRPYPEAIDLLGPGWELFGGSPKIAIESSSAFDNIDDKSIYTKPLAKFPKGTRMGRFPFRKGEEEPAIVFAVGGDGPRFNPSRFIALADPAVFRNDLIAAEGADNLRFAHRLIRWLKSGNKRTHCLFIENGEIKPKFDEVGLSAMINPRPPIPKLPNPLDPKLQASLTKAANKGLNKLQENNLFNRPFVGGDENQSRFPATLRTLAGILAVVLAVWLLLRSRAVKHAAEIPKPPFGHNRIFDQGVLIGSQEYRWGELISHGNVRPILRAYLESILTSCGLETPITGTKPPNFEITGPGKKELARSLTRLWTAFADTEGKPIFAKDWEEYQSDFEELQKATFAGRIRFAPKHEET